MEATWVDQKLKSLFSYNLPNLLVVVILKQKEVRQYIQTLHSEEEQ